MMRLIFLVSHVEAVERDVVVLEVDASDQRVGDGARLLVDLLEHVVLEAALFGLHRRPRDHLGLADVRLAVEVADRDAVALDHDHLALVDEDHPAGLAQHRGDIRRDEVLVLAEADHERRAVLRRDQRVRLLVAHHHERVAAAHLGERAPRTAVARSTPAVVT